MTGSIAETLRLRLKAGGVHLLGSLLLASLAALLVFKVWYPAPLASAQGVDQILLLLIGVDVVIGPLITTLVFVPNKKGMLMDIIIIVTLQLSAMLYGMHTIFAARPALIVFNVDRFDVVAAADMQAEGLEIAEAKGKPGLPWFGPKVVAAILPDDPEQRTKILFSAVQGGPDLPQLAQWQVPYTTAKDAVIKHTHPLAELKAQNDLSSTAWVEFLQSLGGAADDFGYLPMRAKTKDGAVIIKAHSAQIVRIVLLQPKWK